MARPKVEINIPKDLGLTRTQVSDLKKSFQNQLVETLKAKSATAKAKNAKSKQMVVDVVAKSKNQVV
jgi:hypothetical protein